MHIPIIKQRCESESFYLQKFKIFTFSNLSCFPHQTIPGATTTMLQAHPAGQHAWHEYERTSGPVNHCHPHENTSMLWVSIKINSQLRQGHL